MSFRDILTNTFIVPCEGHAKPCLHLFLKGFEPWLKLKTNYCAKIDISLHFKSY